MPVIADRIVVHDHFDDVVILISKIVGRIGDRIEYDSAACVIRRFLDHIVALVKKLERELSLLQFCAFSFQDLLRLERHGPGLLPVLKRQRQKLEVLGDLNGPFPFHDHMPFRRVGLFDRISTKRQILFSGRCDAGIVRHETRDLGPFRVIDPERRAAEHLSRVRFLDNADPAA